MKKMIEEILKLQKGERHYIVDLWDRWDITREDMTKILMDLDSDHRIVLMGLNDPREITPRIKQGSIKMCGVLTSIFYVV